MSYCVAGSACQLDVLGLADDDPSTLHDVASLNEHVATVDVLYLPLLVLCVEMYKETSQ